MYVDFKVTSWERVEIPEGKEAEFKALIESGEITSAEIMFQTDEDLYCEKLHDTDEQMIPEDNGGCSTIDVLDEDGETIWKNAEI